MNQYPPFKPLSRLYSVCLIKEVDSPRSDYSEGKRSFLCQKALDPVCTDLTSDFAASSQTENQLLEGELQFSIDDLFSKIQRIKSQFTPNDESSERPLRHVNSTRSECISYRNDWSNVLKECDQNRQRSESQTSLGKKLSRNFHKNVVIEDFQLGKTLGSGKFGDVIQCRHKATGTIYALKKIFKSTILEYKMVDQLVQELKIHYTLNQSNIVKLYCHFEDSYHIFLLMEHLDGGTLMDLSNRDESYVSGLVLQTLKGVEYLHRRQIAHRDIKPQNLILTHGMVKVCDFGWAANCETGMKKTFCGTLDYVSPEVLQERQYSIQVDLWSIGVLTFQLLTGFAPFNETIPKLKMNKIKNIDKQRILFPPHITQDGSDFIGRFLKKDPNERMSLREALQHPFIKKYSHKESPIV